MRIQLSFPSRYTHDSSEQGWACPLLLQGHHATNSNHMVTMAWLRSWRHLQGLTCAAADSQQLCAKA